ncbi:DNA-deoxyinosine glycosylase [Polymorphobacter megasporae]|uniref:DNA-deoxyinosine glycosylase n=1 Tax=Glacieibacterium megasporae TaxID=2835787 RepID=UPI001C1E7A04|nr:DNA-deoxyinosine glycosylase [Polymorphobacter megasporae]UAJ11363.1 DNA-deoxyinosine glycosylase [Polymorphobacter megasporae]
MTRHASFAPVVDARTRVLILGSLPGVKSLEAGRYYAHPQNGFWRLTGSVVGVDLVSLDYPDRLAALLAAGIGVWDVIATARRSGSLDEAIRDIEGNDLAALVATLPDLRLVAFNGQKAASIGTRLLRPGTPHLTLPSSSPAYTMAFAGKAAAWAALRMTLANRVSVSDVRPS